MHELAHACKEFEFSEAQKLVVDTELVKASVDDHMHHNSS
jgi:hypothetical protein